MRGSAYATALSMVAAALPLLGWLSTVIVALVCLRTGIAAGSMILLWTMLPVGVAFYFVGDPTPMIALLGTGIMAMLLRQTRSWELVLLASVVFSGVGALASLVQIIAMDSIEKHTKKAMKKELEEFEKEIRTDIQDAKE